MEQFFQKLSISQKHNNDVLISNLKYIFKFGISIVFNLADYNMYHSDFKPPNFIIVADEQNKKKLKAIDLG